eukprot:6172413-Pleurochrysis_carterae.AAC.5
MPQILAGFWAAAGAARAPHANEIEFEASTGKGVRFATLLKSESSFGRENTGQPERRDGKQTHTRGDSRVSLQTRREGQDANTAPGSTTDDDRAVSSD